MCVKMEKTLNIISAYNYWHYPCGNVTMLTLTLEMRRQQDHCFPVAHLATPLFSSDF